MSKTIQRRFLPIERLDDTFQRYPATFRSALEVVSGSFFKSKAAAAIRSDPNAISTEYNSFLSQITILPWQDELGFIISSLHLAMATFAERDCKIPAREEVLVGLFRGAIVNAIATYLERARTREANIRRPQLYSADLNIRGREKKTGGDIAFILDVKLPSGDRRIVPVCLQIKRSAPTQDQLVNIRRFNKSDKTGDHQLKALETFAGMGADCAYLFFNNHMEFALSNPILPLVKSLRDVMDDDSQLDVDLAANTIDFASYMLHLSSNSENAVSEMRELAPLISTLVEGDITHLVLLSSDNNAWENLLEMTGEHRAKYESFNNYTAARGFVDLIDALSKPNSYERREAPENSGHTYKMNGGRRG